LYPTKKQAISIHKSNHFLAKWNDTYRGTGKGLTYSICAKLLTSLKQQFQGLKEADAHALQSSLRNLDDAFHRFFQKQNDAPHFKKKRNLLQSYTTKIEKKNQLPEGSIKGNKIKLSKLGWVKFVKSKVVAGRILSATVRRTPYFVSVLCEKNYCPYLPVEKEKAIGIDLG
jgi:putative transposase